MFDVYLGQSKISYKTFIFNGGEVFVELAKIPPGKSPTPIYINGLVKSSNDVMELLVLTDALRQDYKNCPVHLTIPYFPYARQDRIMEKGQGFSVKVMANLINAQNYASVLIYDPHSDVTPALINNVEVVEQYDLVYNFVNNYEHLENAILVAPDSGALKKVMKAAHKLAMPMVRADKNRDVKTGQITETVVYTDHVGNRDFLIIDDICDGGRTFIELAKVLKTKTTGKVYLYVTHGIFANGLEVFNDIIEKVYCVNAFNEVDKNHPLLETNY